MDQGELNKHQLKRLHLILQPFMLRRLKKDVEQEIAPKIEETIHCVMTHRQKVLYDRIKSKISVSDLF
jgi:DNA helicase INO80